MPAHNDFSAKLLEIEREIALLDEDYQARRAALLREAEALREADRHELRSAILKRLHEHGLTLHDLRSASRIRRQVKAKFRDPATGVTWSGRGRAPAWILAARADGREAEYRVGD